MSEETIKQERVQRILEMLSQPCPSVTEAARVYPFPQLMEEQEQNGPILKGVSNQNQSARNFSIGQRVYYRLGKDAPEVGPYTVEAIDDDCGVTWLIVDEAGTLAWVNSCVVTRVE